MFGELMGNMKAQQEEMERTLKAIKIDHTFDGISVQINASKEIMNIDIKPDYLDEERKEELEDKLILVLSEVMKKADEVSAEKASGMINSILPGGLNGMFGQ